MSSLYHECIELLKNRNVSLYDIAECVLLLQKPYYDDLTIEQCEEAVESTIRKREVQHAIITGINIDMACEEKKFYSKSIEEKILEDYSLYGVDEVLAYGICNLYGSIALTNFGYIDKTKPGIIGELNNDKKQCNTFLDDIVGAIAAAAASRLAHRK
ncbi:MAG: phosphatidylglycerophosphatase A [Erysipelotrichaceae bacterium]|nr:phosphatidylglycerophosphatase A [Erysipelotrichaceae bacterium]